MRRNYVSGLKNVSGLSVFIILRFQSTYDHREKVE